MSRPKFIESRYIVISCLTLFVVIGYYTNGIFSTVFQTDKTNKLDPRCWNCTASIRTTTDNTDLSTTEISTEIPCLPKEHIVFLKTHKTGSSTMATILQRFGVIRNLTFAVPKRNHIISRGRFNRKQLPPGKYDLLVNHVRYNRKEMEAVTKPDTKYITIIRDPATQLESVFGYFQVFKHLNLSGYKNPYRIFISRPQYYLNKHLDIERRGYLSNPLLYDFGLDSTEQLDISTVKYTINKLDEEFDLVMLQEYFNESLLLLKKLFCWQWDDILYLIKGVRIQRLRYGDQERTMKLARTWCASDAILYDHFNVTFWKKVKEYGPEFETDLKILEAKLNETIYKCTIPEEKPKIIDRFYSPIPKPGTDQMCNYMLKPCNVFTKFIQFKQWNTSYIESK